MIMTIYFIALLFFVSIVADDSIIDDEWVSIDETAALVATTAQTGVITQVDVETPDLAGNKVDLEELVNQELFYQDGDKKGMGGEEQVERYLRSIQEEHDMTRDEIEEMFAAFGLTYEQGVDKIGRLQVVNTNLDFEIRSNLMITPEEIQAYYDEHPEFTEAHIFVSIGRYEEEQDNVVWGNPFWLNESELADDKKVLLTVELNQEINILNDEGVAVYYKVLSRQDEQLVSLDDRHQEIEFLLLQDKYRIKMEEFTDRLSQRASVLYV
jgi:hypothetical protein